MIFSYRLKYYIVSTTVSGIFLLKVYPNIQMPDLMMCFCILYLCSYNPHRSVYN